LHGKHTIGTKAECFVEKLREFGDLGIVVGRERGDEWHDDGFYSILKIVSDDAFAAKWKSGLNGLNGI